ncbi:MAG: hypothetical protein R3A11_05685 [Bdellovibrionota bacterium]
MMATKKKKTTKTKVKAKAKKASSSKKSSKEILVVNSKVRAYIKKNKMMTSSEFVPALSEFLYKEIDKAIARAAGNKRSTLRARDL